MRSTTPTDSSSCRSTCTRRSAKWTKCWTCCFPATSMRKSPLRRAMQLGKEYRREESCIFLFVPVRDCREFLRRSIESGAKGLPVGGGGGQNPRRGDHQRTHQAVSYLCG